MTLFRRPQSDRRVLFSRSEIGRKARLMLQALESRDVPANFLVSNNLDVGVGSLRAAMASANAAVGADTVTFDAFFATPQIIPLSTALPNITEDVSFVGPGAANLVTVRRNVATNFNIFNVAGATNVAFSGMTITNGATTQGGGIFADTASVTLSNCDVSGNTSTTQGGGIFLSATGQLTVQNSTISGNAAGSNGGGIYFFNDGALSLRNSTVSGNSAKGTGGGIYFFGTVNVGGFNVENSTIHGNSSTGVGGGVFLGALTGTANFTNSTITGNTSTGANGGGLARASATGTVVLASTVVAENANPNSRDVFINGGNITANNSFFGAATGLTITGSGNIATGTQTTPTSPQLGTLQNNGGPTFTRLPIGVGPLVNAGSNTLALATDQRGAGFPRVIGVRADIGAAESTNATLSATTTPPAVTASGATTYTFTVVYSAISPALINVATLGTGDITVAGSGPFNVVPTFISAAPNANAGTIIATYSFTPPGGSWDIPDNGNYDVVVAANEVFDTVGGSVPVGTIGTISVAITNQYVVTNLNNSGVGSLRSVVGIANAQAGPGIVTFQTGLSGVINLTTGEILISDSVQINGPGASVITVSGAALPSATNRIFNVNGAGILDVGITGLTLSNGKINVGNGGAILNTDENLTLTGVIVSSNTSTAGSGGGVSSAGGTLTIDNSLFTGNTANGGGFANGGGAVYSFGTVVIQNSILDSNVASSAGGGLFTQSNATITGSTLSGNTAAFGAGFFQFGGTATVQNSTITGNAATSGGGAAYQYMASTTTFTNSIVTTNSAFSGGGVQVFQAGTLTIAGSTVAGNTAKTIGGGLSMPAGGTLSIVNSTLSGNSAAGTGVAGAITNGVGGGLYFGGSVAAGGATISNSTISGNGSPAGRGAGLNFNSTGLVNIRNSTITNNSGTNGGGIASNLAGGTFNFVSTAIAKNNGGFRADLLIAAGTITANNSAIGEVPFGLVVVGANNKTGFPGNPLDPLLGPLGDNGGPTFTHALFASSPLINAGSNPFLPAPAPTADQRGLSRTFGAATDIGALEVQPTTVVSIVSLLGPTNAATINYTVTFTQPVVGLQPGDFSISTSNATIVGASVTSATPNANGTIWTVVVSTGIDNDPIGTTQGTLTLRLNVPAAVSPPLTGVPFAAPPVTIDKIKPVVTSIVRADPQQLVVGSTANFTVTFSEPIASLPPTNLVLRTTGNAKGTIGAISGSGTTWNVTITGIGGNGDIRLDAQPSVGSAIRDLAGNPLFIPATLPTPDEIYWVGAPVVNSVTTGQVSPTSSQSIAYVATFNRPLTTGPTASNFDFNASGITGPTVTSVTPVSTTVYNVTVDTGSGDGVIQLILQTTAGIAPVPVLIAPFNAGPVIAIDKSKPILTAFAQLDPPMLFGSTVRYALTFNEPVQTLAANNFTLNVVGLTGSSITGVTGSGLNYTVGINVGSGGNGTIQLSLTNSTALVDLAGNPVALPAIAGDTYTIDRSLPGIASISQVDPALTNLSLVRYRVQFTEPVTGLTAAKFSLVTTGLTGAGGITLTGSGADYLVTVNTGTGSGSLRLDLSDRTGIFDGAGNQLSGTATGPTYTIDRGTPTVVAVNRIDPSFSNANTVRYAVVFNKPVVGLSPANFALTGSGLTGAALTAIAGTGTNYVVSIQTGSGNGTLGLTITNSSGLSDSTGNSVIGLPFVGAPYSIDRLAPTVSIARAAAQVNPSTVDSIQFTVVFSEVVTGFSAAGITLGGSVRGTVIGVSGSGTTYTVDVLRTSGTGDLTASVNAAAASDAATNKSTASTAASVTYDLPPVGKPDTYKAKAGSKLTTTAARGVLVNDSDPEGRPLTAVLIAGPPASAGKLVLNSDGSFNFTPAAGFSNSTSFTYAPFDGRTQGTPVVVTIDVAPKVTLTAVGADAGGGPEVIVYNADGTTRFAFFAYSPSFTGGVRVATGDITGDGVDDIITVAGPGGGPHISAFDGVTGENLFSFFAYDPSFTGGLYLAVGDVNGDGVADIITGAGEGGGPHVRVFNGKDHSIIEEFFAYDSTFRGGVRVGVGDVDGDGLVDIVTGAGPGAGPHVKAFRGTDLTLLQSFFAFDRTFTGGVNVAVGIGQDTKPVIIAGSAIGTAVRVFGGNSFLKPIAAFDFASDSPGTGVRLATKDTNGDGLADVLYLAPGPGELPRVRRLKLPSLAPDGELVGFSSDFLGGLFVG